MAFIENELDRALFALLEIKRYLEQNRDGDALYDCEAVLLSFENTAALARAQYISDHR